MSTARSSQTATSSADASRVAGKRKQQQGHFRSTVLASIYQQVPTKAMTTADAPVDNLLEQFAGVKPKNTFIDTIKDYTEYDARGFNAQGTQSVAFHSYHTDESGKEQKRTSYRHLGTETSPDNGPLLTAKLNAAGKPEWANGQPVMSDEPVGAWRLERAQVDEVTICRPRSYVELGGELRPISVGKCHGQAGARFAYLNDVDPEGALDPTERIPVITELEYEDAQVMDLDGKLFAHRNFLGWLVLSNKRGDEKRFAVMNCDDSTITKNRTAYQVLADAWEAMTSDERRDNRISKTKAVPRGAGFDAYLVNQEGVLNRKDNMFIPCARAEDGTVTQVS